MTISEPPAASKPPARRPWGAALKDGRNVAVNNTVTAGAPQSRETLFAPTPPPKGWAIQGASGGPSAKPAQPAALSKPTANSQPRGWVAPLPPFDLEQAERIYLDERALTVDAKQRAGIFAVVNAIEVNCGRHRLPCFVIPYHDPLTKVPLVWHDQRGTENDVYRVRYLAEPPAEKGKKKPQRYRQPKGQPNFAYFAPGYDWKAALGNPEHPIFITEGEFKALCGCEHGVPTIGLGGIDNFTNDGMFLPELEPFVTGGRTVTIIPDSDFSDKPGVQAAVRRLVAQLQKRGANVHIALLPPPPRESGLDKLGLDDAIKHLGIDRVVDILDRAPPATDFPTVIDVSPARLPENLDQLDQAFASSDLPLYQRSGSLVHVAMAGNVTEEDDVRRNPCAHIIRELSVRSCQQFAMKIATFTKWDAKQKGPIARECPYELAEHYLAKVDGWGLSELQGIVEAPTIRADGTVLQRSGYDKQSGILYEPNASFPHIPEQPTRADALAALKLLRRVVRGFPFATPEAESVWLAAAMTAVIRRILRTAPMFALSAPVMGSGKTLLADLLGIIATGHEPAVMSQGGNPEEDSKRLLSVLLRGDSVTVIDNCERPIEGDSLCSILTQAEWQSRILGRSELSKVRTNTTFIATGNNLSFKGDMSTRALMCKLLPNSERPEERKFDWDAREETRSLRPQLVVAVLTMIRAYVVAGCPDVSMTPFGRFEEWQKWVQAPLLWLGAADPCKTREWVEQNDPDRETFGRLVGLWNAVFGQRPTKIKGITGLAAPGLGAPPEAKQLLDLICELAPGKGSDMFNAVVFGKYLRSKEDRMSGGLRLVRGEDRKEKVATWALVTV